MIVVQSRAAGRFLLPSPRLFDSERNGKQSNSQSEQCTGRLTDLLADGQTDQRTDGPMYGHAVSTVKETLGEIENLPLEVTNCDLPKIDKKSRCGDLSGNMNGVSNYFTVRIIGLLRPTHDPVL